ncbi:MAG: glutamate-1-semialdehyde 2,1-aminomutase [Armatimonadota bacterium]
MKRNHSRSQQLFETAQALIPGGVNSPVRAFKSVGGVPPFIARGAGARIWDVDGNEYLDFVGSWGPLILGHARPEVVKAACDAARLGTTFGAPTEWEVRLAEAITQAMPSVELVRLVSSGTEAVMSALRLARAYTGRTKIIKFEGAYHGHADGLLARAGSGLATLAIADSPGVPPAWAAETIVLPFNDLSAVRSAFEAHGAEIACLIVEPVAGNMGVVPPAEGFLAGLREEAAKAGALLIFDEVITGFRVGLGGAQALYRVTPDLTVLGKIIGGGFPLAAFGGRRDVMSMLAPAGPVYQAGTLSGNPVACAAGAETLRLLAQEDPYPRLDQMGSTLADGLKAAAARARLPLTVNRVGSMVTAFFTGRPVTNWATASSSSRDRYAAFFHAMLDRGVHLPPSQFEAVFISAAHTESDIEFVCRMAEQSLSS